MNLSKMAGGVGDLEHGKQIIFEMHNVDWMNAQTRLKELDLKEREFNYLTKPLMKNIIMPPFLNTPTDLSVGEFAAIMGGMESFVRMQMAQSGTGAMGEAALKGWARMQKIRDGVEKRFTDSGTGLVNDKKVDAELAKLYNDPDSDYRMAQDLTSQFSYSFSPQFRMTEKGWEPVPWNELPRAMQQVPHAVTSGIFQGARQTFNNFLFKQGWRSDEVPMPPSLGPPQQVPKAGAETKSEIDLSAVEEY